MNPYAIGALSVISVSLILYASNVRLKFWQYLLFFLLAAGFAFLARANAHMPCRLSASYEIQCIKASKKKQLTDTDRKQYAQQALYHRQEGDSYVKRAENVCWYFPDKSDRERALDCFRVSMAAAIPGDALTKGAAMLITLLTQHGIDCLNGWTDIKIYIEWAEYHYELYEFYTHLACTKEY